MIETLDAWKQRKSHEAYRAYTDRSTPMTFAREMKFISSTTDLATRPWRGYALDQIKTILAEANAEKRDDLRLSRALADLSLLEYELWRKDEDWDPVWKERAERDMTSQPIRIIGVAPTEEDAP